MRLALIADIHGNLPALEAVVEDISRRQADVVVNLGDHASGPLFPAETVRFVMSQDWLQLAGNHERQLTAQPPEEHGPSDAYTYARLSKAELDWLASLPPTATVGDDVFLCHGTPQSDVEYFVETVEPNGARLATLDEIDRRLGNVTQQVVACGHTHLARCVRSARGQLIVNPGSVGLPALADVAPFPHLLESGSPDARYAIVERRGRDWTCDLIAVPYDHGSVANLALERQREDWDVALRTGFAQ